MCHRHRDPYKPLKRMKHFLRSISIAIQRWTTITFAVVTRMAAAKWLLTVTKCTIMVRPVTKVIIKSAMVTAIPDIIIAMIEWRPTRKRTRAMHPQRRCNNNVYSIWLMKTITMNKRTAATVNIHGVMDHGRIDTVAVINRTVRPKQRNHTHPNILPIKVAVHRIRSNSMIQCFHLIELPLLMMRMIAMRNGRNGHRMRIIIITIHQVRTVIIMSNFAVHHGNRTHRMCRAAVVAAVMHVYSKSWPLYHGNNHWKWVNMIFPHHHHP